MASYPNSLLPVPTPPPTPLLPGASHAPQPPAPPRPVLPAALLAQLLADGIVEATTTRVDFRLSDHALVVNGEPQSAQLLAKYRQQLGLAGGSSLAICLQAGQ